MEERSGTTLTGDELFRILKLIEESDWDEIELTTKDFKFVAGQGLARDCTLSAPSSGPRTKPKVSNVEVSLEHQTKAKSSDIAKNNTEVSEPAIRAPMVGTFYTSPSPGAPPYVQVGDIVAEHSIVGIIEVMKVMKSIEAGVVGRISAILVENGKFVQYNEPLFLIGSAD
jgi:acetyl-CoA carboxylase biotin carboxyl carrier protein